MTKACKELLDDPLSRYVVVVVHSNVRVRGYSARALVAIFQPKYTKYSGNLSDREGLVNLLFVTHDRSPAHIQNEVMKALSEFVFWTMLTSRYVGRVLGF
jgi:hypothetical protein